MNGGHQAVFDAEVILQNLGNGGQAVGGAGSVGYNVHVGGVFVLVNAHNKHGSVSRRSGDNNLLGTGLQVSGSLFDGGEHTGGFHDIIGADSTPGDFSGVFAGKEFDLFAVNNDAVIGVADFTVKLAVHGVIAQHVRHVVRAHEGVVDAHKLNFAVGKASAENQTADAAETIDAYFNHLQFLLILISLL